MIAPVAHPAVRLADTLGRGAAAVGLLDLDLDPERLIAEARRRTGLEDLGAPAFRPALDALCRSCDEDADLHVLGRRQMRDLIVRSLVTRLRLAEAARLEPDLDVRPLPAPLLVCGLPRSGTTFLHRLLAEAHDARALKLYELAEPLPGPGPDRRRAEMDARMARLRRFAPANLDAQHLMRADLPDECGHLFKPTFLSSLYWQAPVTGYLAFYPRQDARVAYREYRRLLTLLQAPDGRRFVLKDPFHAMNLPALFAAIPNAMVVQTHRAPSEVVPSLHKLALTTHAVLCRSLDVPRVVEADTDWLATVAARSVDDRARVPDGRVVDVDYRRVLVDPVGVVRRIHGHFGLPWSATLEARLSAFVAENGQRRHGENPYSAEAFGQTAAGIDARFAAYRERFLEGGRAQEIA